MDLYAEWSGSGFDQTRTRPQWEELDNTKSVWNDLMRVYTCETKGKDLKLYGLMIRREIRYSPTGISRTSPRL